MDIEASGEVGNVYGGSANIKADWYVLDDIYEYICEKYKEMPDYFWNKPDIQNLHQLITGCFWMNSHMQ